MIPIPFYGPKSLTTRRPASRPERQHNAARPQDAALLLGQSQSKGCGSSNAACAPVRNARDKCRLIPSQRPAPLSASLSHMCSFAPVSAHRDTCRTIWRCGHTPAMRGKPDRRISRAVRATALPSTRCQPSISRHQNRNPNGPKAGRSRAKGLGNELHHRRGSQKEILQGFTLLRQRGCSHSIWRSTNLPTWQLRRLALYALALGNWWHHVV